MLRTLFAGCVLLSVLEFGGAVPADDSAASPKPVAVKGPLSPEESLKHLVLADPNLVIEIAAAEPEVIDPVSMQFDEHGRMWVVEMRDYPTGPQNAPPPLGGPEAKPLSRIKLLEDNDGDGRFETAHVFAENLLFATGVQPWDGGVIVTHSGEIVYLKDTDGDHKADVREVWFTGFSETNTQLRANHPTFGPDGWIYVANGLRGGNVIAVKKDWPRRTEGVSPQVNPDKSDATRGLTPPVRQDTHDPANPKPVSLTGRDFKFDPLTGRYEAISGNGQFGLTFDAWGNRFVCDNRHPCRHVIFEEDFIKRCPHVAFPAVVHDVIPPDDKNQVFPLTSAWTTSNLHAGTFTAACGVCVYTGDWMPKDWGWGYQGDVFVCEPTGNLVQRAVLEPDGVTFKSRNPHEKDRREFLASRDDWFRPVDLQNGPDGALYVVDMYRAVIEHPEWVPDELKNRPDQWLGNDKGRIYRIRQKKVKKLKRESVVSLANLEASFNSKNGWHRMTAARIRREKPSESFKLNANTLTSEWARCLAIQLEADAVGSNPSLALPLLLESEGWVRARFIALASREDWPEESRCGLIQLALWDSHPTVRLHGLIHLVAAKCRDSYLHISTTKSLISDASDRWLRLALVAAHTSQVFSDEGVHHRGILDEWETSPHLSNEDGLPELALLLGEVIGGRSKLPHEVVVVSDFLAGVNRAYRGSEFVRVAFQANALLGVATGLARQRIDVRQVLHDDVRDIVGVAVNHVDRFISSPTVQKDGPERASVLAALRTFKYGEFPTVGPRLKRLVESSEDQTIRLIAFDAFASFQNPEANTWLLERYRSETPAIRRAILSALMTSKERQLALLGTIADGKIAATEIDPVRAKQLTEAKDEAVREKARQVLAVAAPASRKEVLEAYQPALTLKADPQRGREIFQKNCVTCHRVGDLGVNVAPDISDTRTKKPEQLLLDILDPNRAIDANYFAYAVVTKDGKTESGVIASESSNSITLKQPEGKTLTLLRSDIEELRNTGLSLMPVGVEKNINQQAMADLIFWLKNWRYLDGKVPATSLPTK